MNRQLQLIQNSQEDDCHDADKEHVEKKRLVGTTTLHQSSIVRWLSLSDLLESIKNAYPSLVILLNKCRQSARIRSINIDLVDKLISFLHSWKIIFKELQQTKSPSLFLVLPCITFLLEELASGMKREKSGEHKFFLNLVQICFS